MIRSTLGRNKWRTPLVLATLLGLYWTMAVTASRRVGITADEPVHLTGGYSYWRFNDYRLQPENGMLAMRVAALPLLPMNPRWVSDSDPEWQHSFVNSVAYSFLFQLGNPRDRMLLTARATIALFGMLSLWLIWRWAGNLFGASAGWLALMLAVFSPAMLAHGALATSDMAVTACLLAAITAFWRLLHVITWTRLALATATGGAVLLAKMSGVLAAPMLAVLLLVRWARPAPIVVCLRAGPQWIRGRAGVAGTTLAIAATVAAGSLVLLWAGYGFRYAAFAPDRSANAQFCFDWAEILDEKPIPDHWPGNVPSSLARGPLKAEPTLVTRALMWTRDHRLLPEAYLWGMAHTYKFSRSRPAFLNGDFRITGWPQFFPWTFWLKTTLPVLGLFAAGTLAIFFARPRGPRRRNRWLYRAAPLLALVAVYWAVALRTHLNIGHRHILPTYPVVFVFAGAAVLWLTRLPQTLATAALVLALAAHALDSLTARPFYLSYFQPLAGGPTHGWRHLVDSSYDWGQGLPDFTRWLETRALAGDTLPVYLTYFGNDSPRNRQLRVIRFADESNDIGPRGFPVRPHGGWFAISATHFQRIYLNVAGPWTEAYERLYQRLRRELSGPSPAHLDTQQQARVLRATMDFEVLQFGRLCHYLRDRDPLEVIGGSILLFRLSDREIAYALTAPLNEIDHASSPRQ